VADATSPSSVGVPTPRSRSARPRWDWRAAVHPGSKQSTDSALSPRGASGRMRPSAGRHGTQSPAGAASPCGRLDRRAGPVARPARRLGRLWGRRPEQDTNAVHGLPARPLVGGLLPGRPRPGPIGGSGCPASDDLHLDGRM